MGPGASELVNEWIVIGMWQTKEQWSCWPHNGGEAINNM